jgi:hypothetical protein
MNSGAAATRAGPQLGGKDDLHAGAEGKKALPDVWGQCDQIRRNFTSWEMISQTFTPKQGPDFDTVF